MTSISDRIAKLPPEQRAQLERRLVGRHVNADAEAVIPRRADTQPSPLSFAQQRLWFLDQLLPDPTLYLVPITARLIGELNADALQQALNAIVARHEVLRSTISLSGKDPVQIVHSELPVEFKLVDLTEHPAAEREAVSVLRKEAHRPLDLSKDCMLRACVVRIAPEDHFLLITVHHIASDGWSQGVLLGELSALYESFRGGSSSPLQELPIQYADFAVWQRNWMSGERLEKQLAYWKKNLAGAPPVLDLPTDHPRLLEPTYTGAHESVVLPPQVLGELQALSRAHGATLYMTLLSVFNVLLSRYSGQNDIVVGSPIANRNHKEVEGLIGFFINMLAVRTDLSGDPSFADLLARVRETMLGAYAHQDLPFERLVDELQVQRGLTVSPLFQVMFILQNNTRQQLEFAGLEASHVPLGRQFSKFDLTLSASETDKGLRLSIEYAIDLFDAATIERVLQHFRNLVQSVLADPQQRVSRLNVLSKEERRQLLTDWNTTRTEYPRDLPIHQVFERQAEQLPDSVAIRFEGQDVTYAQLNARSNQLARHLQQLGVGPETPVAVFAERSIEMVVALLGVLKAGGTYLPLDTAYPPDRLAYMIDESSVSVVLTQSQLVEKLPASTAATVCLDAEAGPISSQSIENLAVTGTGDSLAYVMYTSGSTGKPKGVQIPHRGVVRLVRGTNFIPFSKDDVFLQLAPISFDASTLEIWGPLLNGGVLVVFPPNLPDLSELGVFISRNKITTLWLTSSLFQMMVSERLADMAGVRYLLTGGDVVPASSARRFLEAYPGSTLVNGYGPTENTTFTCCNSMTDPKALAGTVPIGRPIANTEVYILDASLEPVPLGAYGELYTGGDGLARGYVARPDLTSERFVANPFSDQAGAKLYRTGDRVRWLPDGRIDFVGRIDQQVKIRGYRIELGEIEAVLGEHPGVREAAAIVREDHAGDKRLHAYVVAAGDADESDLRTFLTSRLPQYMVPFRIVYLAELPATATGKVDRLKLAALPVEEARMAHAEGPIDDIENRLKSIWENALSIDNIGVEEDFFDIGGHSLLAIRLLSDVKSEFAGITLAEMLRTPTILAMARLVRRKQEGSHSWSPLVPLRRDGNRLPLFCAPVGGGSAFYYRTLAEYVGSDQPIYAFEPIGMNGVDAPHETVEEMAAYYIEHLRLVQANGPYYLCGLSFGGIVAYEMARQLTDAGETVGRLILFDTWAPGLFPVKDETHVFSRVRHSVRHVHYKTASYLEDMSVRSARDRWNYLISRTPKLVKRIHETVSGKPWKKPYINPVSLDLPEAFRRVREAEGRARRKYQSGGYSGSLLLLRARVQRPGIRIDPLLGWRGMAADIQVIETPGTHFSMLEEPCVRVSVSHVRRLLDSCDTSRQSSQEPGPLDGANDNRQRSDRGKRRTSRSPNC